MVQLRTLVYRDDRNGYVGNGLTCSVAFIGWLQLRFDCDSTVVRLSFDCIRLMRLADQRPALRHCELNDL